MVPVDRPLISTGYKYNDRKVLYFIVTDNAGITKTDIPYLSKYPYQFTNVAIHPVALPLVMSTPPPDVNEVDSHNKSRQSYLALEKWWVTQFGWLWLCTGLFQLQMRISFPFLLTKNIHGFLLLMKILVVRTENRDSVWEQVICSERGSSVRTENRYSFQEQVIRLYVE